ANQAPLVQAGAGIRTPANGAPSPAGEGGGSGNGSGALPNTTNAPISPALPGATQPLTTAVAGNGEAGGSGDSSGYAVRTHSDLATRRSLSEIAQDLEGDTVFWRILGAEHGTARLAADGQTLLFTPEAGFAGDATLRLQADDGFA
ncbi:Ig-like domain-containing protein, partial [Parachitinimonas caeni]